jgi:transposase InsO family protein
LSIRQASWLQRLAPFDLEIIYRSGSRNPADGLSRRPDLLEKGEKQRQRDTLLPNFLRRFGDSPDQTSQIDRELRERTDPASDQIFHREPAFSKTLVAYILRSTRKTFDLLLAEESSNQLLDHSSELDHSQLINNNDLITAIRKEQAVSKFVIDKLWQKRRSKSPDGRPAWQTGANGILRFKRRIYLPPNCSLQKEILHAYHDNLTAGHQEVIKTLKRIAQTYFWDSLHKDVKKYVGICTICQRTKARHHLPYGVLARLLIPKKPWEEISMNFIVGLPEFQTWSGRRRNSVLVIVDRFTKYALFIPTSNTLTTSGLADVLLAHVFSRFGIPKGIISDRGSLFISKFWATFCHHLAMKRKLSTAYYPQTDGQTERVNQQLEHYLRTYCCFIQNNWVEKLPMAEWTYNTATNASFQDCSPAKALMGYQPRGPWNLPSGDPPERVIWGETRAKEIQKLRQQLIHLLEKSNKRYNHWYNKKRIHKNFKVENQILISIKHVN